jgi:hypothetical protein
MAERAATVTFFDDKTFEIRWTGLLENDTGAWVAMARYADKTIQVIGTFGASGDVDIQGSNELVPGALEFGQLSDPQGVALSIGDVDPIVIAETPRVIRPEVDTGDGTTDLTVIIVGPVKGV